MLEIQGLGVKMVRTSSSAGALQTVVTTNQTL
jgi:hypothetical protein